MIVIGFRAHPKQRWFRFKIFILIISAKKFISKRSHSEILGTQIFWGPQFNLQQDLLLPESFLKMIILYLNNYLKNFLCLQLSSVTQSCLSLCDPMDCSISGFPVPLPTPLACSNSCPLSWWCHPAISCSIVPFVSCLLSFPASGSFPVSQLFTSGG